MKIIKGLTIQQVYKKLIKSLKRQNIINGTKEINNCCLVVKNPTIRNYYLPYRDMSEKYLLAESEWYWSGDNRCETIGKHAKMWLKLSDDGITNNSAYGYILEKKYGFDQIQQIITLLRQDTFSRRAVLNISDPSIDRINTKDMQCTIAIQFLVRHNRLEETVYMRSNDVFFGLPYDYFYFVSLGQYIASKLNLKLGLYTHHATSMHMYLRDEKKFINYQRKYINIDINELIERCYGK